MIRQRQAERIGILGVSKKVLRNETGVRTICTMRWRLQVASLSVSLFYVVFSARMRRRGGLRRSTSACVNTNS